MCFVYGTLSIDAKLDVSKEASAGDPAPFEALVSSNPKGEIGLRSELGADWMRAEGKLAVDLSFQAKVKLSTKKPLQIDWHIDFGGSRPS